MIAPQHREAIRRVERRLNKIPRADISFRNDVVESHFRFLDWLGSGLPPGARILDFGCGVGDTVKLLLDKGYDAFGVDILEWWDGDNELWGVAQGKPPPYVAERLRRVADGAYRLPFPDGHFDFCFSDQVFEHVFNYPEALREIGRVLKPGALSTHRFPGPNTLVEGHVQLPFPLLCGFRPYLAFWALVGRRSERQAGLSWRDTLAANLDLMRLCQYPTKRALRRYAAAAGVNIDFYDREEFRICEVGGMAALRRKAEGLGLGGAATALLGCVMQRYMVVRSGGA